MTAVLSLAYFFFLFANLVEKTAKEGKSFRGDDMPLLDMLICFHRPLCYSQHNPSMQRYMYFIYRQGDRLG